jgi:hypothetical protein
MTVTNTNNHYDLAKAPSCMKGETSDAEALKARGNACFKAGDLSGALDFYTQAIAVCSGAKDGATLFANRAAVHLKQKHYQLCVDDCTDALKLDDTRDKAFFRRAQAHEGLDQMADAFKDVRRLIQLCPNDKAAIALATRLKEKIQVEALGVGKAISSAVDQSSTAAKRNDIAKGIAARAAQDSAFAKEFVERDGIAQLTAGVGDMRGVVLVLGALVEHAHLAASVMPHVQLDALCKLVGGEDEELAKSTIFFLRKTAMVLEEQGHLEGRRVRAVCFKAFITAVGKPHTAALTLACCLDSMVKLVSSTQAVDEFRMLNGLKAVFGVADSQNRDVYSRLTLLLMRVFQHLGGDENVKAEVGALCAPALRSDDRTQHLRAMTVFSTLFMMKPELGVWALSEENAMLRLCEMAQCGVEWIQTLAVDVLAQAAALDDGRRLFSAAVLETLQLLLHAPQHSIVAGAASALAKMTISAKAFDPEEGDGEVLLQSAFGVIKYAADEKAAKKQEAADAKKQGKLSKEDAAAVLEKEKEERNAGARTASPGERGVEAVASLIRDCSVKEEVASSQALGRLVALAEHEPVGDFDDDTAAGRAAARASAESNKDVASMSYGLAFIFSQLTVTEQELKAQALRDKDINVTEYDELQKIQNMHLEKQREDSNMPAPREDTDSEGLCKGRCQRFIAVGGVAALVQLAGDGEARASARVCDLLGQTLCHIARVESMRGAVVQQGGLKLLLQLIERDSKELRELRDEVSGGKQGGGKKPKKFDPRQMMNPNGPKLTEAQLLDEEAMKSQLQITEAGVRDCAQAAARLLISTNPNLLSRTQQLSSVPPLLELARGTHELQQFEACLALTNLTSVGEEVQDFMVQKKAVQALSYLQFSDQPAVQRAASECLVNMMSHEGCVQACLVPNRLKLWVALCYLYEEEEDDEDEDDEEVEGEAYEVGAARRAAAAARARVPGEKYKTASAAAGALATMAQYGGDEAGVHRAFAEHKVAEAFCNLASSGDAALELRAAVGMAGMAAADGEGGKLASLALLDAGALKVARALARRRGPGGREPDPGVAAAAGRAEEALRRLVVTAKVESARDDAAGVESFPPKVDALDYRRFELDTAAEEGEDGEDELEETRAEKLARKKAWQRSLKTLSSRLTEEEQQAIMDAETPEAKLQLLQDAVAKRPELAEELQRGDEEAAEGAAARAAAEEAAKAKAAKEEQEAKDAKAAKAAESKKGKGKKGKGGKAKAKPAASNAAAVAAQKEELEELE